MFKNIAAIVLAVTLAMPAQAQNSHGGTDPAGALLFGLIAGVILNEAINDNDRGHTHTQTTVVEHHYHRPAHERHYDRVQRCGWYEEAERHGNRIYYYRYDACDHRLIGERWEWARRH